MYSPQRSQLEIFPGVKNSVSSYQLLFVFIWSGFMLLNEGEDKGERKVKERRVRMTNRNKSE